jgi:C-terminal processing protease CtpA/Prc
VQPDSPAAKAGLKKGDVVSRVADQACARPTGSASGCRRAAPAGQSSSACCGDDKAVEVTATLTATSRPMKPGPRVYLGAEMGMVKDGEVWSSSASRQAPTRPTPG